METKKTQKEIVLEKLEKEGKITNLWCIQHGIWRLSDVILHLRNEGHEIVTEYNTEKVGKNCHYYLKSKLTLF